MFIAFSLTYYLIVLCTITYFWLVLYRKPFTYIRKRSAAELTKKKYGTKYLPKPQWVITEIIKLAALYPTYSGHKLAFVFNRLYANSKGMTVSKSWVYKTLSRYKHEVLLERRRIKAKPPCPHPQIQTLATGFNPDQ